MEPPMKSIYIIGSLRNPRIPEIAKKLREAGFEPFDDWFSGGPEADDCWLRHQKQHGRSMRDAIYGHTAQNIFHFDRYHIKRCDAVLMVMPAGKSGHLELGYAIGLGKPGFIMFDKEPERWDVMYAFATEVFSSEETMMEHFAKRRG